MASPQKSSDTLKLLPLLQGSITLKSALEDDDNTLQRIKYPEKRIEFFVYLFTRRAKIEAIVSYHLGLGKKGQCRMGDVSEWIAGSYNVCIPVHVCNYPRQPKKRVLIRFPLPYKIGEIQHPGNADEKLRCEAATFIWIQSHCQTIPIPLLWGFGFPGGQSVRYNLSVLMLYYADTFTSKFTKPANMPFHTQIIWYFRRTILSLLGYPLPCQYISYKCPHTLGVGYLLMDYIEETEGKMLSESWDILRHDQDRRINLFRDLSRIMLSLASLPLPRIGSFTIDDRGMLGLTNRPLTLRLQDLENGGVPTEIDRNLTYSTTEAYLLDLLACHDNRIRHQPNSIRDKYDGQAQLAALTIMRAICRNFVRSDLRHGPFILMLTDLHQSNIFVDSNWNIKRLIDLEWACSLPIEMLHPPHWLTSRGVDQLERGDHLDAYESVRAEFADVFEEQERLFYPTHMNPLSYAQIMRKGWAIGNFWYFQSLNNPRGLYNIFLQHIQPKFGDSRGASSMFDQVVAPYWSNDMASVVAMKIKDKGIYDDQLRKEFETDVNK